MSHTRHSSSTFVLAPQPAAGCLQLETRSVSHNVPGGAETPLGGCFQAVGAPHLFCTGGGEGAFLMYPPTPATHVTSASLILHSQAADHQQQKTPETS